MKKGDIMFKRKLYQDLLLWKNKYAGKRAVLIEGARRVGKSTLAYNFAINEYKSHIIIDFANISKNILELFEDIHDLDIFFIRLQAETGVTLYQRDSVIIFDEAQLFPKARQAIKYLVNDGRYGYIETEVVKLSEIKYLKSYLRYYGEFSFLGYFKPLIVNSM